MVFSLSSFLSTLFLCGLLLIYIRFFFSNIDSIIQIGMKGILILIGIILIRLIFPFEFVFSYTVASRCVMPQMKDILNYSIVYDFTIGHFLILLWILGMLFSTVKTIKTRLGFGKFMRRIPQLPSSHIHKMLYAITQEDKSAKKFQVVYSKYVLTPMLYGFGNPYIILPAIELTEKEWFFVLKHELAHYHNKDLYIKMLIQLLKIIYWWNPMIYFLDSEINKMLEIRADFVATKQLTEYEKVEYLDCLLKVAKNQPIENHNFYSIAFKSGECSLLKQRFYFMLKNYKYSNHINIRQFSKILPIIFLLCASFIFVFEPYSMHPDDAIGIFKLDPKTSYLVINTKGGYDLYIDNNFTGRVEQIRDSYSNLKIYHHLEEVKHNGFEN